MTKLSELIPGQVWEDENGFRREIVALGPETIVTRGVSGSSDKLPSPEYPFVWPYTDQALSYLVRLHRARQTKWLCLYRESEANRVYPGLTLWATKDEAQFYSRVQGLDLVAIVPVEFAPGDNLPQ